jgi:hypothetical protein
MVFVKVVFFWGGGLNLLQDTNLGMNDIKEERRRGGSVVGGEVAQW